MSNDMSYDDVCAIAWIGHKASKETPGRGIVEKEFDERPSSKRDDGGKKGSKGSTPDWYGDRDKGGTGNKGKGKGKSETQYYGMNCPYKWTNSIDEEDGQGSSWENVSWKEKMQNNSRVWRHLMMGESGAGPEETRSPDGESEWPQDQHFTTLPKMTRMSKRLED